jgi:hypothetical protein
MKTTILLLLISVQCFSQTGRFEPSISVNVSFETWAGVTTVKIENKNECTCKTEVETNGLSEFITLDGYKRYFYTLMVPDFVIRARNLTFCKGTDDDRWVTATSDVRMAKAIKLENRSTFIINRCNDIKY